MDFGALGGAIVQIFSPFTFFMLFLGTSLGIVVGAIPGLTAAMVIALTLPLTFYMQPFDAVVLLIAMYVGGISGGLITATLMRMPGTPAAVMTTLDGYPMAKGGNPGRALGLGITASFVGGIVSWMVLFTVTQPLSILATRFGPFEYFTLIMMAMVLIASVSEGSLAKGLIAGLLGMLISMPGVDPATGSPRLTFGYHQLNSGFDLLPVLIGVFAVSQVIKECAQPTQISEKADMKASGVLMNIADYRRHWVNMLRSSAIGTWIGILPGIGASIGSVVAYTTAKNVSREPEKYGHGSEEGIIASEAANNATVGGALIPLIAMGIPGSVVDAILIGALMIHSITPGPMLFITNSNIVWGMIAACLLANILMFVLMMGSVRQIAKLIYLPRSFVLPAVMMFCVIGSYALNNVIFDVWVMLAFGIVGFLLERARIPLGPFVIGFVLAPLAEQKLRSGLMMSGGDFSPLVTRPFSLLFLIAAVVLLVWPLIGEWRRRRLAATNHGQGAA